MNKGYIPISADQLVWSYAVKYERLVQLINTEYAGSEDNVINIHIDLSGIFRALSHHPKVSVSSFSLASAIINLCAHYRNFFNRYYKTYSRFFLIFSNVDNSMSINRKFYPQYKRGIFSTDSRINDSIMECINLLDTLVPYLNDIGLYKTNYEFGVKIMDIVSHYKNPNIIITKDAYSYQLISDEKGFVNILRPVKSKDGDESYIINKDNAALSLFIARKCNDFPALRFNPSVLSLIMTFSRVPERNISSQFTFPKVLKVMAKAIESGLILNEHTVDIEYIIKIFSERKLLDIKDPNYVIMKYRAIDIESQYLVYMTDPIEEKFTEIKNLYDPLAVKEISMKYFKDYPLDLNVL